MRDIITAALVAVAIAAASLFALPGKARSQEADLCLVLLLDSSGSVEHHEWELQVEGTARALENTEILQRMFNGPTGRVAILVAQFGERFVPMGGGWHMLTTPQDVAGLTRAIRNHVREAVLENTHLGNALWKAGEALRTGPDCVRRTVDVSGDGEDNCVKTLENDWNAIQNGLICVGPLVGAAHIAAQGALVNTLMIDDTNREHTLRAYTEITSGFMREASWPNYASGILAKIETEVSLWPVDPPLETAYMPQGPGAFMTERDWSLRRYLGVPRIASDDVNEVAGILLLLPSILALGMAAITRS